MGSSCSRPAPAACTPSLLRGARNFDSISTSEWTTDWPEIQADLAFAISYKSTSHAAAEPTTDLAENLAHHAIDTSDKLIDVITRPLRPSKVESPIFDDLALQELLSLPYISKMFAEMSAESFSECLDVTDRLTPCPFEIRSLIADHLALRDLKSLRQVSQCFVEICALRIFGQALDFTETSSSLERLTLSVVSPSFAAINPRIKTLSLWSVHSWRPGIWNPLSFIIAPIYADHTDIRTGRKDVSAITFALGHLPNVRAFNIESLCDHKSCWRTYEVPKDIRDFQLIFNPRCNVLCGRALAVVTAALHTHKRQLHSLKAAVGMHCLLDEETYNNVVYTFRHLRTLQLHINLDDDTVLWHENEDGNGRRIQESSGAIIDRRLLANVFEAANEIQDLQIHFEYSSPHTWQSPSLEHYVGTKSWPGLRSLDLVDLVTSVEPLLRIIKRNASSLRYLALTNTTLRNPGHWPRLFDGLREYTEEKKLELETIIVSGKMAWGNPEDYRNIQDYRYEIPRKFSSQLPEDYTGVSRAAHRGVLAGFDNEPGADLMLKNTMAKYIMDGGVSPWDNYEEILV